MKPVDFTDETVARRHFYTKSFTDILAIWTGYFKDPVCALIFLYLHEEQYKELLVNGEPGWSKKMTVRTISVRLNIPKSTVHTKLKYMASFEVIEAKGNNFRLRVLDDGTSSARAVLPNVGTIFDKMVSKY